MKLNLGCGFNKVDGWTNVDKFEACNPDLVFDLEQLPWPFESSSVEEALFNHSLEHVGGHPDVFLGIMAELYRICISGAKVQINVPHPRHDHFLGDPTHVRAITPDLLRLFSKRLCLEWQQRGLANSPLALYIGVDFEIVSIQEVLDNRYYALYEAGKIGLGDLQRLSRELNNVIQEYQIVLKVIK